MINHITFKKDYNNNKEIVIIKQRKRKTKKRNMKKTEKIMTKKKEGYRVERRGETPEDSASQGRSQRSYRCTNTITIINTITIKWFWDLRPSN